jgi:hypothetical protein
VLSIQTAPAIVSADFEQTARRPPGPVRKQSALILNVNTSDCRWVETLEVFCRSSDAQYRGLKKPYSRIDKAAQLTNVQLIPQFGRAFSILCVTRVEEDQCEKCRLPRTSGVR